MRRMLIVYELIINYVNLIVCGCRELWWLVLVEILLKSNTAFTAS
jgi:hypothetical protein